MSFILTNINGGYIFITSEEAEAWEVNPEDACQQHPGLLERLHKQTHDRGFNYSDFSLQTVPMG